MITFIHSGDIYNLETVFMIVRYLSIDYVVITTATKGDTLQPIIYNIASALRHYKEIMLIDSSYISSVFRYLDSLHSLDLTLLFASRKQ